MPSSISDVLRESHRLGFLGDRPIDEVIAHARSFVDALEGVTGTVVDLGAGGGVPGLVIAHDRPDLSVTLIDRRSKRTDFLSRMVMRMRWTDRVEVVSRDVESVVAASGGVFDAAVARGFGPPEITLEFASRLVRPGGLIVISEPPTGDRWDSKLVAELGLRRRDQADGRVAVFDRDGFT